MFNGRKTNKHLVPLRSHSSFLQRSNTVIVFNVSILICMAMRKRKESHLANLSGSLQGMKVATRFGSIPVTQIPASCESFRKRLAIVPWGFRSIFKRKRLWSWPSGNQRRGGVGGHRNKGCHPASLSSHFTRASPGQSTSLKPTP